MPSVKVPEDTTSPASEKKDGEDEAMVDQGVIGAHFQSDGMDVQPKEEKGKAVAKADHHGKETQDGASLSQAMEQIKITDTPPKHTVVKANESEAGASSSNQPVPQRAVHFASSAGTIPDASQSRARFDGVTGLPA